MPPPIYLIELRLTLSRAVEGTLSVEQAEQQVERLGKEWHQRVNYWKEILPTNLRNELLGKQYQAGVLMINDAKALISQLREGRDSGIDVNYLKTFDEEFSQHRQGIVTLVEASTEYASSAVKGAEASSEKTVRLQLVGSGVSLFLLIIIGVWVNRTIFRSLGGEPHQVADIANAVARGDLTQRVEVRQGDNTSVMAAMQVMCERLTSIINIVNDSSLNISTRSENIVNNNIALAARTEQQASALEQTAASMEQMTATVKQNADNAQGANQFADTASNSAEQGGRVMDLVVETMEGISHSASKISDITSVIDGIAFQTNILALNAAVEAARAGEQGRGFAVVAGEVRNLSQRSAEAAKEIKNLIEESVSQVASGSQLVGEAGKTMETVVKDVKHVARLMTEITHASEEQSRGIEQVSIAITQMDATTQQNAIMVNQATAETEALHRHSHELNEAVSHFRL